MTSPSAPPGAPQAAQTANELILSDDQAGIKYGGRTYNAVLELADGTKQKITDPKALQRIIKILNQANFQNETQDLSQTTITQKAVNLNGKNLLGTADSETIAKVTKTFNKIIRNPTTASSYKSPGNSAEGIHFQETGKPKTEKNKSTGDQTERLKEEPAKVDKKELTPEQLNALKKSDQEQEKKAAFAKEAAEQAKAKKAKEAKKQADKKAEAEKGKADAKNAAKQTDASDPKMKTFSQICHSQMTTLPNTTKMSPVQQLEFFTAREKLQDSVDALKKTNKLETAPKSPNKLCAQKLINQTQLKILTGDLLKENVDVIVNAANKKLGGIGNGGVCQAIFDAGKGPKGDDPMQRECDLITANIMPNGLLPIGQAVMTNSGYIPGIKRVIHTPGPDYRVASERAQIAKLKDCYYNSMKLAADNGYTSIAFPSISTGIFKVPAATARKLVIEAIEEFVKVDTRLKEVHLVVGGDVLTEHSSSGYFK